MKKLTVLLATVVLASSFSLANAFEVGVDAKVGKYNLKTEFDIANFEFDGTSVGVELLASHRFDFGLKPAIKLGFDKLISPDGELKVDIATFDLSFDLSNEDLYSYKIEGLLGYEINAGNTKINPFIGVGYNKNKIKFDLNRYDFYSNWDFDVKYKYWKVGIDFSQKINDNLGVYANLSFEKPFDAEVDLNIDSNDPELAGSYSSDLEKKYSYNLDLGMTFAKNFKAGVFYEYKKLDENVKSTNYGVKVGVSF